MPDKAHGKLREISTLLACVAFCCIVSCKRTSDDPLTGWKAISEEPAQNAILLQQAERSQCVWRVGQDAGTHRITIQQAAHEAPKEHQVQLQTETGVLVGTDNGEYGGGLILTDDEGVLTKRLLDTNVLQLLPSKSGVLVFTGLLHLSVDEGAVWLYSNGSDGNWSIKKIAALNGKPSVISSANGDVLAVGAHGVSRLDQALNLTEITLPFAQVFPNSITEDVHGSIYVGMNAFVVRLVPAKTGYTHEWFTKPGCLR
jgi:hypothetical protein